MNDGDRSAHQRSTVRDDEFLSHITQQRVTSLVGCPVDKEAHFPFARQKGATVPD